MIKKTIYKLKTFYLSLINEKNDIDEKAFTGIFLIALAGIAFISQIILSFLNYKVELMPEWMYISTLASGLACFGVSGYFEMKNNNKKNG